MGKVLSFGELLLRISPDGQGQWLQENKLAFYVGGAELNVATALALWGVPSAYLTALPENFLSEELLSYLNAKGIDTKPVVMQGDRVGIYYLPKGKDVKNAGVIYDRAGSAFADLKVGNIDWEAVFAGVSWFHFSAICPAINQNVADVCAEALAMAKAKGIQISLDLNYRAKLWKYGKEPVDIMPALAASCDLIMGNVWAANKMLGMPLQEELVQDIAKDKLVQHAQLTSKAIINQFPKCHTVANTFRFDHGQGIRYFTTLYTRNQLHISQEYVSEQILDKVGSGDCFMAGLIYGFQHQHSPEKTLEFATAAAFNKLFSLSDATTSTVADIEETMKTYAN
ncbi:sugar kinase [Rufibacter sp. LB8]|uniref:sugar kinase n=1 Tax=Rufibacter sp. LB8 TaxID=2777781 RepID=UPI00178C7373|nr:sugar kinase [Rufibacter sp. LB8]